MFLKLLRRSSRALFPVSAGLALLLAPLFLWAQYPTFAIIGDTHVGSPGSVYREFIQAIDDQGIRVIIHVGDAIDRAGSTARWKQFFDITGQGKTLHLVPGNHDVDNDASLATFLRFFPKPYYSFAEGDTLFVLLNTELPGEQGRITGQQFDWLESELGRPFKYKFVFLHEPLFPAVPGHGLDRHEEARDRLHQLFVRMGVSLVVAGHDHVYRKSLKDNIAYVIASGGGGRFYLSEAGGGFLHYLIGARTDGHYLFVVKDMKGEVRDRFIVRR